MSLTATDKAGSCSMDAAVNRYGLLSNHDLALRPGERWLCVHTAPRRELVAGSNLGLQGYRNFVPTMLKKVKHARKVNEVQTAFFPRYIFAVLATETQSWRSINGTIGVNSLVMESGRPKYVPEGVVEALIHATNGQGFLDFRDEIKVGQKVRLLDGPFANFVGDLARLDHRGRVAVLLQVMGGERLVTAEKVALQPVA